MSLHLCHSPETETKSHYCFCTSALSHAPPWSSPATPLLPTLCPLLSHPRVLLPPPCSHVPLRYHPPTSASWSLLTICFPSWTTTLPRAHLFLLHRGGRKDAQFVPAPLFLFFSFSCPTWTRQMIQGFLYHMGLFWFCQGAGRRGTKMVIPALL